MRLSPADREQIVALGILLLVFGGAAVASLGFPPRARTYPLVVGVVGVLITAWELLAFHSRARSGPVQPSLPGDREVMRPATIGEQFPRVLPFLIWIGGYLVAVWVAGLVVASGLFVGVFLSREGRVRWHTAVLAGAGIIILLVVLGNVLGLRWPASAIAPFQLLGLL